MPQLIERINQALGYKAVAGIRLVQAPIAGRARTAPAKPPRTLSSEPKENASRLESALARMAAGVKARRTGC